MRCIYTRFAAVCALFASLLMGFPLALPAQAQETAPADISAQPSGVYKLDKSHASLRFEILHLGFAYYQGRFNDFDATLTLNPQKPEDSTLTVSIKTDSVDTNNDVLEKKLLAENVFNAEQHPEIRFVATQLTQRDARRGTITGDLTLRGTTKPVTLDVELVGAGNNPYSKAHTIGFRASGSLKRSDFGITEWLPAVGDAVALHIDAEFAAEKAAEKAAEEAAE